MYGIHGYYYLNHYLLQFLELLVHILCQNHVMASYELFDDLLQCNSRDSVSIYNRQTDRHI